MDSWIDFCAHEIELPATVWCYPVIGYMPYNHAAVTKAKEDLKTALGALESALLEKTYLVRNAMLLVVIHITCIFTLWTNINPWPQRRDREESNWSPSNEDLLSQALKPLLGALYRTQGGRQDHVG